jgi:hypothetical protein
MGKVQDDANEETRKICLFKSLQPKLKAPELGLYHEYSGEYEGQLCRMPLTEGTTSRFPLNRKQFSRSFISDARKLYYIKKNSLCFAPCIVFLKMNPPVRNM